MERFSLQSFIKKAPKIFSTFGENNTKSRIKNILNDKKSAFWMVIVAILIVAGAGVGLSSNSKALKESDIKSIKDVVTTVSTDTEDNLGPIEVELENALITTDLEQSISNAILSHWVNSGVNRSETAGEGHVTLEIEEKNGMTYAYILERYAQFGFENEILTVISGHANPSTIVFQKDGTGNYILKEFIGTFGYLEELQKMFSESALKKYHAVDGEKAAADMDLQVEAYARAYLEKIGIDAEMQLKINRATIEMDVAISNYLVKAYHEYPYCVASFLKI